MHTVTGMGSAALAAAVPHLVRRHEFPAKDDGVLEKKQKKQQQQQQLCATEHNVLPY